MTSCDRLFCLVALGITLLITTKPGKARLQRKTRQLDIFDEFEDFDILGSCPQGWIEHDGSCYTPFAHGATWQEAEDTCREIDSHLALSRGATENEFIAVEVGRPESRVWIGLRRIEGEFVWSDGRKADYTNWGRGEPKGGSDCVSLLPEDIFHSWEVTECNVMQAFICERENTTSLDITEGVVEVMDRSTKATTGTTPTKTTSAVHVLTESSTEIGARFVDICSKGLHDCSTNGTCISLEGSFDCECNLGYEGDGRICADINECDNGYNDCHYNATCTNVPGSYHCQCNEGFHGSGKLCEVLSAEVDETKLPTTTRHVVSKENGTRTSSTVSSLRTDAREKPTVRVSTKDEDPGKPVSGTKVTETEILTPPIPPIPPTPPIPPRPSPPFFPSESSSTVVTTGKDETMTPTNLGPTEAKPVSSVVTEEKQIEKTTMMVFSKPTTTAPVSTKSDTGDVQSRLIDPCSPGTHNCSVNATCVQAVNGSYDCRCNLGFEGDGNTCVDIDECATNDPLCDVNATCFNTDGSFSCHCKRGFIGNGLTCRAMKLFGNVQKLRHPVGMSKEN